MKEFIFIVALLAFCTISLGALPPLKVYSVPNAPGNQRYLAQNGNIPFFWTADTAWEIFIRLNESDVEYYLNDRSHKKYNVIQVTTVWDITSKNAYGDVPFDPPTDPTKPNEKFWAYADRVLDMMEQKGFYVAIWPIWGCHLISWGAGNNPPSQQIFNPDNSYLFGKWIGNRYKDRTNIVWVLGGDIAFPIKPANQIDSYRAMAEGIAQGVVGGARPQWNNTSDPTWQKLLMSLHPTSGLSSSTVFEQDAWLRFNLIQSGWRHWEIIVPLIEKDYTLTPTRPTFMGEGAYEWDIYTYCNMPDNTNDEWGVRFNSYWSVFAGGFGTAYGANGIYQFERNTWKKDLDYPGAGQIQFLRKLMESHNWTKVVPDMDNTFIPPSSSGNSTDCALVIGTYASDGTFGFVYNTKGIPFSVNLKKLSSNNILAKWLNPRTGEETTIGTFPQGLQQFKPSGVPGNENDWVLVLESM